MYCSDVRVLNHVNRLKRCAALSGLADSDKRKLVKVKLPTTCSRAGAARGRSLELGPQHGGQKWGCYTICTSIKVSSYFSLGWEIVSKKNNKIAHVASSKAKDLVKRGCLLVN